jgi:hypothetical protein
MKQQKKKTGDESFQLFCNVNEPFRNVFETPFFINLDLECSEMAITTKCILKKTVGKINDIQN